MDFVPKDRIYVLSADPDFRQHCRKALPEAFVVAPDQIDVLASMATAAVILYGLVHVDEWDEVSRIRSAAELRDTPLIVLTGWIWADGRSRRRARELQCTAVIAKPCPIHLLVDTLQRAVAASEELS